MAGADLHMNPFYFAMLNTDEDQRRLIDMEEGINKYLSYIIAITNFDRDQVLNPTRKREYSEKRQQVIYLLRGLGSDVSNEYKQFNIHRDMRNHYLFSLIDIGAPFRKDHATVLYSANKIKGFKSIYPSFKAYMDKLERYLVEFHIEQVNREHGLRKDLKYMNEEAKGMLYLNKIRAIAKDANYNLNDITTPAFRAIEKILSQTEDINDNG